MFRTGLTKTKILNQTLSIRFCVFHIWLSVQNLCQFAPSPFYLTFHLFPHFAVSQSPPISTLVSKEETFKTPPSSPLPRRTVRGPLQKVDSFDKAGSPTPPSTPSAERSERSASKSPRRYSSSEERPLYKTEDSVKVFFNSASTVTSGRRDKKESPVAIVNPTTRTSLSDATPKASSESNGSLGLRQDKEETSESLQKKNTTISTLLQSE